MSSLAQSISHALGFCFITGSALTLYALGKLRIGPCKEKNKTKDQRSIEQKDTRPKVIVVTGCDTGFGRCMAEAFGHQKNFRGSPLFAGNDILVVALTLTDKGARSFDAYNDDHKKEDGFCPITAIKCDVTLVDDVQAAKARIESLLAEKNAVLYAIVNNAGILSPGDFVFYNDLTIPKRVMEVNYFGQLAVTQALLPSMLSTSRTVGGKILNLSSVCGKSANPGNSAYAASKFAIEAWSNSLRLELQAFNIQVATIRAGAHATDIQMAYYDNYVKNYERSSDQVQALYGGKEFSKRYNDFIDTMDGRNMSKMTPASGLVDTVTEALMSEKLQPSYWSGSDANTFFKAMTYLPTVVVDFIKTTLLSTPPKGPELPPPNSVAHVTIRVRNIERSLKFYEAIGFETVGPREHNCQFLRLNPSNNGMWESLLLLKEDKDAPKNGEECHNLGMTRLCILSQDIQKTISAFPSDLEPYAPLCKSEKGSELIASYRDPDGFIVYVVELKSIMLNLMVWWLKKKTPCLFHWTINVSDSKKAMSYFEKSLGFQTLSDQNKDQVVNDLLPAFKYDPSSTVIEWIRLANAPKGGIVATIMEWVSPKSILTESSASNAMTLSVTDVQQELEKAKAAGFVVEDDQPFYEKLPIYGTVKMGRAYVEKGSSPIEYCCFSDQKP